MAVTENMVYKIEIQDNTKSLDDIKKRLEGLNVVVKQEDDSFFHLQDRLKGVSDHYSAMSLAQLTGLDGQKKNIDSLQKTINLNQQMAGQLTGISGALRINTQAILVLINVTKNLNITYDDLVQSIQLADKEIINVTDSSKKLVEGHSKLVSGVSSDQMSLSDSIINTGNSILDHWDKLIVSAAVLYKSFDIIKVPVSQFFSNLAGFSYNATVSLSDFNILFSGVMASFSTYLNKNAYPFLDFFDKLLPNAVVKSINIYTKLLPLIIASGYAIKDSEDKYVSFAGSIMFWGGLLTAGLPALVVKGISLLGDALVKVGYETSTVSDDAIAKLKSLQIANTDFERNLEKVSKNNSDILMNSKESWNDFFDALYQNSYFSRDEILRSASIIMNSTKGMGLSFAATGSLLMRIGDVASTSNKSLVDTTNDVMSSLNNLNASHEKSIKMWDMYQISLDDVDIKESDFIELSKLHSNQMTEQQLKLAKLNVLYEQTNGIYGSTIDQVTTLDGLQKRLNRTYDAFKMKMDETGGIMMRLKNFIDDTKKQFMLFAITLIESVPESFVTFWANNVGMFRDFMGVILVLGGMFLKFTAIVITFVTTLKILGIVLSFVTGASIGLSTILGVITFQIIPLIILLSSLFAAWQELNKHSKVFKQILESIFGPAKQIGNQLEDTTVKTNYLAQSVKWLMTTCVDISAFLMTTFFQAIALVQMAWIRLKMVFSSGKDYDNLKKQLNETTLQLFEVNKEAKNVGMNFLNQFSPNMAFAATQTSGLNDEFETFLDHSDKVSYSLEALKKNVVEAAQKIARPNEKLATWYETLGTEFEKVSYKIVDTKLKLDELWKSKLPTDEMAQKYNELQTAIYKSELESYKLRNDSLKKLGDNYRNIQIEAMKASGNIIGAIDLETNAKLDSFDKEVEGLKVLKNLRKEDLTALTQYRNQIIATGEAEKLKEKAKDAEKLLNLTKHVQEIERDTIGISQNEIANMRLKRESRMKELEGMAAQLKMSTKYAESQVLIQSGQKAINDAFDTGIMKMIQDAEKDIVQIQNEMMSFSNSAIENIQKENLLQQQVLQQKINQVATMDILSKKEFDLLQIYYDEMDALKELGKVKVYEQQAKELGDVGEAAYQTTRDLLIAAKKASAGFKENATMKISLGELVDETGIKSFAGSMWLGFKRIWNSGVNSLVSPFNQSIESLSKISLKIATGFSYAYTGFDTLFRSIAKIFDPEFIQGIADTLSNIMEKLPETLMAAYNALSSIIDKIIDQFPQMVSKLMDSLGTIIGKLAEKMPDLINALMDGLGIFLNKLPDITGKIFAALPNILEAFLNKLPEVIVALFRAIPKIITQILKAIPEIIRVLLDKLPEIIETLIVSFVGALDQIILSLIDFMIGGGLEKIIKSLIIAIPRIIGAIIVGVLKAMGNSWEALWRGGSVKDFVDNLTTLPDKLGTEIKKLSKTVASESSQIFKVLDLEAEAKAVDNLKKAKTVGDVMEIAGETMAKKTKSILQAYWDGLEGTWRSFYTNFVLPYIDALTKAWLWVYDQILEPIIEAFKTVWIWIYDKVISPILDALKGVWTWIYDKIIQPLIDGIKEVWSWIYDYLLKPIFDGIKKDWNTIIMNLRNAWDTIKNSWDKMMVTLKAAWDAIKLTWDNFTSVLSSTWKIITDNFSSLWDTLKSWFEPIINTLSAMWDKVKLWFEPLVAYMEATFNNFTDNLNKWSSSLGAVFDSWISKLSIFFETIGDKIASSMKLADFTEAVKKIGEGIANFFRGGISGMADSIAQGFKDAFDKIGNLAANMFQFEKKGQGFIEQQLSGMVGQTVDFPFVNFAWGGSIGKVAGQVSGMAKVAGNSLMNDIVPIMASPGEYIIPRDIMQIPGVSDIVDMLMSGDINKMWEIGAKKLYDNMLQMIKWTNFAEGGLVTHGAGMWNRKSPIGSDLGKGSDNYSYSINLTVNLEPTNTQLDSTYVRNKLIPTIKDELKKASMKGDFILANRGIRNV